jgi:zinc transporter ZupT
MPNEIPYWAAGLYALLGAAAIALGGGLVGTGKIAKHSGRGVWPAVGAGFLIALGALGALPEACERLDSIPLGLGLALVSFCALLLAHRAGHKGGHDDGHAHAHDPGRSLRDQEGSSHAGLSLHDARLAVSGLALHALLDGVAVSAALASQGQLGLVVAFVLILHKVPEGATAAAITYASGGEARRARRGVLLVAGASLLGGLTIFLMSPLLGYALGLAAGVTAGVGVGIASHLIRHDRLRSVLGIALGAGAFAVSEAVLHS